ncbi:GGDEF domain-containing protein [Solimonas sp. K1W22B-7]|uniref:GGDEF domain-containing protein n=1 Tax=Solimonas sp. K1W22B-7 TaxID=2303331 RepID=UPI0013C4518D|nr:GGDEF domain-containing protein [Solimonas sp. K1W22B-7]
MIELIEQRAVTPVFQPIIDFGAQRVLGFEATSRGALNSPLQSPLTMFETAAHARMLPDLDRACISMACSRFAELQLPGLLFLNCSPVSFVAAGLQQASAEAALGIHDLPASRIVIEITEQQPLDDFAPLRATAAAFRRWGFRIAVDDLGAGYAGLRFWSELKPDYVKIDRHFIEGIDGDTTKRDFVRSILDISRRLGCRVVAEGIETAEELETVRRLGIGIGQGFLLGLPRRIPVSTVPQLLLQQRRSVGLRLSSKANVGELMQAAPTIPPSATAESVLDRFHADRSLLALPVVDNGHPVGVVTRHELLDLFSARYRRELHGRKPIRGFVPPSVIVEENTSLDETSRLLTDDSEQELAQVFIVTRQGRYLGLGQTRRLLRRMADVQLVHARHSNPLTLLPGAVPLNEHIESLLGEADEFCLAYFDLNHFKPYNDAFGYTRGDEVITLLARLLREHSDAERDFVGHIGGDDFVLVLRSADWRARCEAVLDRFAQEVRRCYPAEALDAGGVYCEDRGGHRQFFALLSIAVGVVRRDRHGGLSPDELVALATAAKREAKRQAGNTIFVRG